MYDPVQYVTLCLHGHFQTERDGGYGTSTSEEKFNQSFEDDHLSIENIPDLTVPSNDLNNPPQSPWNPQSSPKKSLIEEAAERFKGRAPIPPVTDTPVSIENERQEKSYNDGERRKLKNTFNTYMPPARTGHLS